MSEFKVGDEVERISGGTFIDMSEGDKGVVNGVDDDRVHSSQIQYSSVEVMHV